jgi:hypothetical protein
MYQNVKLPKHVIMKSYRGRGGKSASTHSRPRHVLAVLHWMGLEVLRKHSRCGRKEKNTDGITFYLLSMPSKYIWEWMHPIILNSRDSSKSLPIYLLQMSMSI